MIKHEFLKKSTLLFFLFIGLTVHTFGQYDKITEVKFEFWHSRRIPNRHVMIEMRRFQSTITIHVTSDPYRKSVKWNSTKRNYSFKITTTDFDKVVASVKQINSSDIVSSSGFSGNDGTTCDIEFGGFSTTIKYRVWSPDFVTKERRLQAFLDACKFILQTARLDPDKIL